MDPMTMMMLAKGAVALGQGVAGLTKKTGDRPKAKVTQATTEAVARARALANSSTRPGRAIAEGAINQGASNALQSAKASTDDVSKLLAVGSAVNSSGNQAMREQDGLDIQAKQGAEGQLQQALGRKSYEEQVVQQDEFNAYDEKKEEKAALIGSSLENAETVASDATSLSLYKKFGYMDSLKGPEAATGAESAPATAAAGSSYGMNSSYLTTSAAKRKQLSRFRNSVYSGVGY